MNANKPTAWACVVALLSGCTSLAVRPLNPGEANREGVAYVLPFTQYTITQTWRVADCTPGQVRVSAKVEATIGQADDADHQYLIDPASLQGLLTRSEFNAAFHENSNMLKSLNVTVEDRTGPFIGNIVRTAVALAPLVTGLPVPGAAVPQCTTDTVAALERVKTIKGELDSATLQVTGATSAVALITESVTLMGAAIDDATRARLGEAVRELNRLRARQADLTAQLADALKPISFQRILRWPTDSSCFETLAPVLSSIDPAALVRWFGNGSKPEVPQVHLAMERIGSFGRQPSACPAPVPAPNDRRAYREPDGNAQGLRYRMPAQGRLVACKVSPCRSAEPGNVLLATEGQVAQLGYVNLLPVRNRAFGTTTFAAEFRAGGSLASAGYAQKAAPLEAASETLASAATSLAPLFDPTQRLARDTAYLNALKAQRDALAAVTPTAEDPTAAAQAAITADTSLLNARIAQLEAQITLARLEASRSPQ